MKKIAYVGIDYHQNTLSIAVCVQVSKTFRDNNSLIKPFVKSQRHASESGHPGSMNRLFVNWIPAFAGMTESGCYRNSIL